MNMNYQNYLYDLTTMAFFIRKLFGNAWLIIKLRRNTVINGLVVHQLIKVCSVYPGGNVVKS